MPSEYLNNFSYLFVPLTTEDLDQFPQFSRHITEQNGWKPARMDNRYLHKYVEEKIARDGYRFRLDDTFAREHGLMLTQPYCIDTTKKRADGTKETLRFCFSIHGVELFLFNPNMCILAFEIRFADDDPIKIASAQYHLRKIATTKITLLEDAEHPVSFVDISRNLLAPCAKEIPLDFFFYATPNNEKANFLTYVDVPVGENETMAKYNRELFYLKWCYDDSFDYDEGCYDEDSIHYVASLNTTWGISISAAVCLVARDERHKQFIEGKFQGNFKTQYLLTYALLLHQKYMMYLFLTKMSVGLDGNLKQLKNYKAKLYEFETHHMFSYISEVPQYQRFYAKVRRVFALDELFRGVQEPLSQLADIQQKEDEIREKEQDHRVSTAITTLSFLTIVSALADAAGITANLPWLFNDTVARFVQIGFISVVGITSIIMIIRLFFAKKR